jgi:hypothetical protein
MLQLTMRKPMPRAVKFDRYGGIDVLRVVEVDRPVLGPEQVLIQRFLAVHDTLLVLKGSFGHDKRAWAPIFQATSLRDPHPAFSASIGAKFAVARSGRHSPRDAHWPSAGRAQRL